MSCLERHFVDRLSIVYIVPQGSMQVEYKRLTLWTMFVNGKLSMECKRVDGVKKPPVPVNVLSDIRVRLMGMRNQGEVFGEDSVAVSDGGHECCRSGVFKRTWVVDDVPQSTILRLWGRYKYQCNSEKISVKLPGSSKTFQGFR